jgi:hypothetical protein
MMTPAYQVSSQPRDATPPENMSMASRSIQGMTRPKAVLHTVSNTPATQCQR